VCSRLFVAPLGRDIPVQGERWRAKPWVGRAYSAGESGVPLESAEMEPCSQHHLPLGFTGSRALAATGAGEARASPGLSALLTQGYARWRLLSPGLGCPAPLGLGFASHRNGAVPRLRQGRLHSCG
jgi:hypothetical protein